MRIKGTYYTWQHTKECMSGSPTAAADKVILEPSSLLAVSCAVALAGSELSSHPLFLYLSPFRVPQSVPPSPTSQATRRSLKVAVFPEDVENMKTETSGPDHSGKHVRSRSGGLSLPIPPPPSHPPQQYSMPFLVTAMLGQSTGKLKVREFCVCPLPNSAVPQQIKMLERLHYELGKVLAAKLGVSSGVGKIGHRIPFQKFCFCRQDHVSRSPMVPTLLRWTSWTRA